MQLDPVQRVVASYSRILLACRADGAVDPKTRRRVSARQAGILEHLDAGDALGLVELARHAGVTASTMSVSVSRLVRAGFVARTRNPKDRRALRLRLTAAGSRIKARKRILDPERVAAALRHLSQAELLEVVRGLELLELAAQKEAPFRTAGSRAGRRNAT